MKTVEEAIATFVRQHMRLPTALDEQVALARSVTACKLGMLPSQVSMAGIAPTLTRIQQMMTVFARRRPLPERPTPKPATRSVGTAVVPTVRELEARIGALKDRIARLQRTRRAAASAEQDDTTNDVDAAAARAAHARELVVNGGELYQKRRDADAQAALDSAVGEIDEVRKWMATMGSDSTDDPSAPTTSRVTYASPQAREFDRRFGIEEARGPRSISRREGSAVVFNSLTSEQARGAQRCQRVTYKSDRAKELDAAFGITRPSRSVTRRDSGRVVFAALTSEEARTLASTGAAKPARPTYASDRAKEFDRIFGIGSQSQTTAPSVQREGGKVTFSMPKRKPNVRLAFVDDGEDLWRAPPAGGDQTNGEAA